jgi:predicted transcriptional regulator
MLAFERAQAKLKLRPVLPCDKKSEDRILKTSEEKRAARMRLFEIILDKMEDNEVITAQEIAVRTNLPMQSAANYLRQMDNDGYVATIPRMKDNHRCWAFAKTGKMVA